MSAPSGQGMYSNDMQPGYNDDVVKPGYGGAEYSEHSTLNQEGSIIALNCDWGNAGVSGKAGACWDCFRCEPCCGEPCNFKDRLYCCCCTFFCGLCMQAKILSYSTDQDCYFVNHCGPILIIYLVVLAIEIAFQTVAIITGVPIGGVGGLASCLLFALYALIRRNIRMKYNVGSPNSWLGDFFMMCCCFTNICSMCQEFRAIPISGWDWLGDIRDRGFQLINNDTLGKIVRL